jgi:hypothetical protein
MKRIIATSLAVLLLGCLVRPANAQYYPYPAPPYANPYGYQQPMMPVNYMPMGNGAYAPQPMPMMQQPVMVMPVMVNRYIPVMGPLETMPANGPLDPTAFERPGVENAKAPSPAPAAPATAKAPVDSPPATADAPKKVNKPAEKTLASAKTAEGNSGIQQTAAEQPAGQGSAKHWYQKTWDYICGRK